MANNEDQIQNAKPIAQLIDAHNKTAEAIEAIIERDVKRGLYKLKAGPRKEQVKLLSDQGLSNRKIAEVLGVSDMTVGRDLGATNVAPTATNVAPKSQKEAEEKRIQELIETAKKETSEKNEKGIR